MAGEAAKGEPEPVVDVKTLQAKLGILTLESDFLSAAFDKAGRGDGYHLHLMARGFTYLAAVLDWFKRRVLGWRVSITLEADFCIEAMEEALPNHRRPEVFNTDQDSSPRPTSSRCWPLVRSGTAWTEKTLGATRSSLSASGGASNTRKSTCGPMPACPIPEAVAAQQRRKTT